jgi:hypothetical protein
MVVIKLEYFDLVRVIFTDGRETRATQPPGR